MVREKVTISFKEDVLKKVDEERKTKARSTYVNDYLEEGYGLDKKKSVKKKSK